MRWLANVQRQKFQQASITYLHIFWDKQSSKNNNKKQINALIITTTITNPTKSGTWQCFLHARIVCERGLYSAHISTETGHHRHGGSEDSQIWFPTTAIHKMGRKPTPQYEVQYVHKYTSDLHRVATFRYNYAYVSVSSLTPLNVSLCLSVCLCARAVLHKSALCPSPQVCTEDGTCLTSISVVPVGWRHCSFDVTATENDLTMKGASVDSRKNSTVMELLSLLGRSMSSQSSLPSLRFFVLGRELGWRYGGFGGGWGGGRRWAEGGG